MKKIFFALLAVFMISLSAYATSYEPQYLEKINKYSTGVLQTNDKITVYKEPSDKSAIADIIVIDKVNEKVQTSSGQSALHCVFVTFSTDKNLYFVTVIDESGDWVKICYDNKTGWVKDPDNYLIWKEFFFKYGKENGLYFFRNVTPDKIALYQKPDLSSKKLASYNYARPVFLKFIRGNWVLASISDMVEESYIIGWIKWRNTDGSFILFPHI